MNVNLYEVVLGIGLEVRGPERTPTLLNVDEVGKAVQAWPWEVLQDNARE